MTDVLSNDQVAALVEAAKSGEGEGEARAATPQRRARRVRTVDFSRPTKFTNDLQRRLQRALDTFARTVSTRLSAELRLPIEMEVINAAQLTWSNAHDHLPHSAICCLVDVDPIETRMLLSAECPFVLAAIERLLGGNDDQLPRERRLTELEHRLAGQLFGTLVSQLSLVFEDVAGVSLKPAGLESQVDTTQLVTVSEPTLELTIEARLHGTSSTLVLLVPYTSIAKVEGRLSTGEGRHHDRGGADAARVRSALSNVRVALRAEVGDARMPVSELLALKPGDVLKLSRNSQDGVVLCADEVPVHRARPGCRGTRKAVQIIGPVGGGR